MNPNNRVTIKPDQVEKWKYMTKRRAKEATSKQVATIAGRVLKDLEDENDDAVLYVNPWAPAGSFDKLKLTVGEVKALAGSALTQREKA